jgi:UrcA family protein
MKPSLHGIVAAAIATTLLVSTANAAAVDPAPDVLTMRVRFADLDLSRDADVGRLYLRLKAAARQVCVYQGGPLELVSARCRAKALADAVDSIHNQALTTLHERGSTVEQVSARAN